MSDNRTVGVPPGCDCYSLLYERITPYLFPQYKLRNKRYLAKMRDLPALGGEFRILVFDFGFSLGNPGLGPLETGNLSIALTRPFLCYGIAGVSNDNSIPYKGFLLQVFHQHNNAQQQWFSKHAADGEICGSGQKPHFLHVPHLFLPGDSVQVEVKNLNSTDGVFSKLQVALIGVEY